MISTTFCALLLASVLQASCLDNGLARSPALGYNTWNAYGGDSKHSISVKLLLITFNLSTDLEHCCNFQLK